MKRLIFGLVIVLALLTATLAGCSQQETPAEPAAPLPAASTGTLQGVTPAAGAEAGAEATLTVVNPIGYQVFPVNPLPQLTFAGPACTLEDLERYEASGESYNCAIIYDNEMGALGVYVSGP